MTPLSGLPIGAIGDFDIGNTTSHCTKREAPCVQDAMLAATPEQVEAMQHASIARLAKTEAARPGLVAAGINSDRKTMADAMYELMVTDLRPELGRIKVPVEVVYAYDSHYGIEASQVDAMFRNAYASTPNISFRRIDGSFHFIMLDQPDCLPVLSSSICPPER